MARLRSGILGNIRGKVAGVVGSQWKDKNYLREYIKPANPNTAAQQAQRLKMSIMVAFCKTLVGPIFNAYTDKFYKSMSGFNHFIKANIALAADPIPYANLLFTEGKLSPVTALAVEYTTGTGGLVFTWTKNLGNNGADTDKVFWAIYDSDSSLWYFADGEVDRSTETDSQTIAAGLTEGDLKCFLFCVKYSGTIIDIISTQDFTIATAP
jgi:hypothetical protein